MQIQIKTGSNLSKVLQSTVTIPQAFTELVKNSIQNNATFCRIDLSENLAVITDDGLGFSHVPDDSGMNGFERYFVFGNSYADHRSQIRLGQMGIGGKLANDKLSHELQPHWSIETKNQHGKSFILEYNPPEDSEFLSDYSPKLTEISDSSIEQSGTKISILSLKSSITNNGWNLQAIRRELSGFFGELIFTLKSEGKDFDIILNGESLKFSYKLVGSNIPTIKKNFSYQINGETRESEVSFRLSLVRDLDLLKSSPLKGIDLISKVKISSFSLSKNEIFNKVLDDIFHENQIPEVPREKIYDYFHRLIGFIYCDDLSTVLDESGMSAKDLSHHSLRDDHPITPNFYHTIYRVVIEWIINYININEEDKFSLMDALAQEISNMLVESFFEDDEIFSLMIDSEGTIEDKDISTGEEFRLSVEKTIKGMDFHMEENVKNNENNEDNNNSDIGKVKKSKYLPYSLVDFSDNDNHKMSSVSSSSGFRVLINSSNPKYKALSKEPTPFLISLHIAECLFREVILYKNLSNSHEEIERKISEFYDNKFETIKESMDQKIISR